MKTYLQQLIEFMEVSKPLSDEETRIWYRAMMLRKAEEIEERTLKQFKYKLISNGSEYYSNSLIGIIWNVLKSSNRLNRNYKF